MTFKQISVGNFNRGRLDQIWAKVDSTKFGQILIETKFGQILSSRSRSKFGPASLGQNLEVFG